MADDPVVARKLPIPVVLIGLFQFFKAGFLVSLFIQFWHRYSAWAASGRPEDSLFLQSLLDRPFMILFPILSVVFVVIGLGLLNLRAWARDFLIGAIICTWLGVAKVGYRFPFSLDALFFSDGVDSRHQHFQTLVCVFLLDLFVFCTLVFYPQDIR